MSLAVIGMHMKSILELLLGLKKVSPAGKKVLTAASYSMSSRCLNRLPASFSKDGEQVPMLVLSTS